MSVESIKTLKNIEQLRGTYTNENISFVYVNCYSILGDGGEGFFHHDDTDLKSEDNGGTIIVSADKKRWHRQTSENNINVKWFGAHCSNVLVSVSNSGNDVRQNVQNAIDYAKSVNKNIYFPAGNYRIGSPGLSIKIDAYSINAVSFSGDDGSNSHISFDDGDFTGISLISSNFPTCQLNISNLRLNKYDYMGVGMDIRGFVHVCVENSYFYRWDLCLYGEDNLFFEFHNSSCRDALRGIELTRNPFVNKSGTHANADIIINSTFASTKKCALKIHNPTTFNMFGGSIEGNGYDPLPNEQKYALFIDSDSIFQQEGFCTGTVSGVYFEDNHTIADIFFKYNNQSQPLNSTVFNINGCTFNKMNSKLYSSCNNNILLSSNTQGVKVNVSGCGFGWFSDYIPDINKKAIAVVEGTESKITVLENGNYYKSLVEKPLWLHPNGDTNILSRFQTGTTVTDGNGNVDVIFPNIFPDLPTVFVTIINKNYSTIVNCQVSNITTNGFSALTTDIINIRQGVKGNGPYCIQWMAFY